MKKTSQFIQQDINHRIQIHADESAIHLRIFTSDRKDFTDAPMPTPKIPVMAAMFLSPVEAQEVERTAHAWHAAKKETAHAY